MRCLRVSRRLKRQSYTVPVPGEISGRLGYRFDALRICDNARPMQKSPRRWMTCCCPYTVDLSVFDMLNHTELREHVQRVGVVF